MTDLKKTAIARMFHWEMGHRLPFHAGGCANVHGHSYRLWLEVEGDCDEHGMLIDYGDLKRLVQPLLETMDHAFLCDAGDTVMRSFLDAQGFKSVIVDFPSTAENIAVHLLREIWKLLQPYRQIDAVRVRLQETDNSYAEVHLRRQDLA
jgi:6-pyruvoyltetrahydropterin/6-carboxytetrahydropterin synthase